MLKTTPKKVKNQNIELLPFQEDFVNDIKTPHIALVGGLGTGKTTAACYKVLNLLQENRGFDGIGCEPTGPQLKVFTREMDKTCQKHGIKYSFKGSSGGGPTEYTFDFGFGKQKLLLVSANNYRSSLVGYNVAFGFIDEYDTIENMDQAIEIWQHLTDRIRVGPVNQAFVTTTPEGYRQVAEVFADEISPDGLVTKAKKHHKVIQVSTYENIHLKPSYIKKQLAKYTPLQAQAKIFGRFVNAYGKRVYDCFERSRNSTNLTLADFPSNAILHVGMDFNVEKMSAVISIIKDGKVYTVEELIGADNTDAMIKQLKTKFPNRVIYVYPDSSGKSRTASSDGASVSSITKLKAAGFECFYRGNNPRIVKERVPAVNAMFFNALNEVRAYVNITKCPQLVKGLEQQDWKDGKPNKDTGLDHALDALGYFMAYRYPVEGAGSITVYK